MATGTITFEFDEDIIQTGFIKFVIGSSATGTYKMSVGDGTFTSFVEKLAELTTIINDNDATLVKATSEEISSDTVEINFETASGTALVNNIPLSVEGLPPGLIIDEPFMFNGETPSGAYDDLVDTTDGVLISNRYNTVVWPVDDTEAPTDEAVDIMLAKENLTNDIQEGVIVLALTGSGRSAITSLANTYNSPSVLVLAVKKSDGDDDDLQGGVIIQGGTLQEDILVQAAQFAAVRSLRLDPGASVSSGVVSSESIRESGSGGAALPWVNTPFPRLGLTRTFLGFSPENIVKIEVSGANILRNNLSNTMTIAGEMLTTYKTDSAGNPDDTYRLLCHAETISVLREIFFNALKQNFQQFRLVPGDLIGGHNMANPDTIRSFLNGFYARLASPEFELVQSDDAAKVIFSDSIEITLDLLLGVVSIRMLIPAMTQYRQFNAEISILFSSEG